MKGRPLLAKLPAFMRTSIRYYIRAAEGPWRLRTDYHDLIEREIALPQFAGTTQR
jgi:hypothetical protein